MQERTDEDLMKAYAQGNIEAFELLYNRHRGPLYRYVLGQVGDPATANDLYQGSWEKIIKARGKYTASAPFRAWMYRITRNHVVDHFRRVHPETALAPDQMEASGPGPEQQLQRENQAASLRDAIDRLPADQRDTLLLKLDAGLDIQTIADITGANREAVKSRLRYAVGKLKKALTEDTAGIADDH